MENTIKLISEAIKIQEKINDLRLQINQEQGSLQIINREIADALVNESNEENGKVIFTTEGKSYLISFNYEKCPAVEIEECPLIHS